jgi:hypothetical protein
VKWYDSARCSKVSLKNRSSFLARCPANVLFLHSWLIRYRVSISPYAVVDLFSDQHYNIQDSLILIEIVLRQVSEMTNLKLKQFKLRSQQPTIWDGTPDQKTTKITLWGTLSWFLVGVCPLFILISSLLIANGSCSWPRGVSASSPVCVGGHLSVRSWLAIVGLEFSVLGLIVIPRIQSVLISKFLTWRLTHSGMPLAKLLNSQTNAPSWTKFRLGLKSSFFLQVLIFSIVITASILFKFSFVRVGRIDTIGLSDVKELILMGCDAASRCNGVSANFIDALSTSNSSSSFSFNITLNLTTSSALKQYSQVFGPSQDDVAHQLSEGDLYLCTPTYYSRTKITLNASDWSPPALTPDSNPTGVRFTNPYDYSILDILSSNGTLQIFSGTFGVLDQRAEYISMLTASTEVCLGYTSWSVNNTFKPTSYLQNPADIACIPEDFNITTWMNNPSTQFPLGVLQGLAWENFSNLPLETAALNIILATLNHTASQTMLDKTFASTPRKESSPQAPSQCSLTYLAPDANNPPPWVATGVIPDHGTGMTLLGAILQGLIIILSLFTLVLLFIPVLPLVTEWPAQWLGLVYGLSPSRVQEVVEGTSAGKNSAKDSGDMKDTWVWLGSGGGDMLEGCPYLILSTEKGQVRIGRGHV